MDTGQLENALRGRLGPHISYKGVYNSDNLPIIKYNFKPVVIIANTLNSQADVSIIGHWVAFYISFYPKPYLLFFDSYGFKPHSYTTNFSSWLENYSNFQIQEFGKQIQPDTSNKCGLYVIHFTHYISHFGLEKYKFFFKHKFSIRKLILNDKIVTSYFFSRIWKTSSCLQWKMKKRPDKNAITYKQCLSYIKGMNFSLFFSFIIE